MTPDRKVSRVLWAVAALFVSVAMLISAYSNFGQNEMIMLNREETLRNRRLGIRIEAKVDTLLRKAGEDPYRFEYLGRDPKEQTHE